MTLKTISQSLLGSICFAIMLFACTDSDECTNFVEQSDASTTEALRLKAQLCEADYLSTKRSSPALAAAEALGELGEWNKLTQLVDAIVAPVLKADVAMVAAKYYRRSGSIELAQEQHLSALAVYREHQQYPKLGRALDHAFRVVWKDSDHREALRFAGEALEVAQKSNNRNHEIAALGNLVKVFQEVGSLGAAQHALDQQRPLLSDHAGFGQAIDANIDQGLVHMDSQKYALAAYSFSQALDAASGSKNYNALRGLNLNLVWAFLELDRFDEAEHYLKQAWSFANKDGSSQHALNYFQAKLEYGRENFIRANTMINKVLNDQGKPAIWNWQVLHLAGLIALGMQADAAAIDYFRKSINASEKLQESLGYNDLKAHMMSRKRQSYEALFLSYVSKGDTLNAFTIAEQAKSKSFLEAYLQNQESGLSKQVLSAATVATESQRIDDLIAHLAFMQSSPVVRPHSATELKRDLSQHQVLSLFVAQKRVFSLVLSEGQIRIKELSSDDRPVWRMLQDYKASPNQLETLQELGQLLLEDVDFNHQSEHLYIAPDELFSELAFASLHIDGKFLVEHKSMSLIPSAGALLEITNYQRSNTGLKAVVMGNPDGDLASAQAELTEVAQLLETEAVTGGQATSNLVQRGQEPEIFHLATHSGVGNLGPWIRFADGDIPAKNLVQNTRASKLAVLASCNSATKDGANLWGSLGGLFLSHGTPSVFVTQWSVKDEVTSRMVSRFYGHFAPGTDAVQALALAQRDEIRAGNAVQDWAAYIILGR